MNSNSKTGSLYLDQSVRYLHLGYQSRRLNDSILNQSATNGVVCSKYYKMVSYSLGLGPPLMCTMILCSTQCIVVSITIRPSGEMYKLNYL